MYTEIKRFYVVRVTASEVRATDQTQSECEEQVAGLWHCNFEANVDGRI